MAHVLLLGATGTLGQATASALRRQGHTVVALVRPQAGVGGRLAGTELARTLPGVELRFGDAADAASQQRAGWRGDRFEVLMSCLASRTGLPQDAWAVDHAAHVQAFEQARQAGVRQIVLLSALCLQKPRLAFQQAKLAAEQALMASGIPWTIVRPTAFFKSLCGQVQRVQRGQPFLLFGDGRLTACKPISDDDLADYLVACIDAPSRRNRILPIGGPGPALTLRDQGELLFEALGKPPRFRQVPVRMMDAIVGGLTQLGRVWPAAAAKAELARIGRYYATESMLVMDPVSGRYDATLTPSTGRETLGAFYAALARGDAALPERGDHSVF